MILLGGPHAEDLPTANEYLKFSISVFCILYSVFSILINKMNTNENDNLSFYKYFSPVLAKFCFSVLRFISANIGFIIIRVRKKLGRYIRQ